MNKFLASLVFVIGFGAVSAQADTLCESVNYRTQSCYVGYGDIILTQQLSSSSCIEGSSWYQQGEYVTVTNGCRGYFRAVRQPSYITCESNNYRTNTCPTPRGTRDVRLYRQLSNTACIEGNTWYQSRGSIVVTNGCRGIFEVR